MTWAHFLVRLFGLSADSRFMLAIRRDAPDPDVVDDPVSLHRALMAELGV